MMANQNTLTLSSASSAQSRINIENPNMPSSLHGPVAILWDIENCPVPSDVRPEDVAGNIRMALKVHPVITGVVTMFSAYGDFNSFPRRLREGCQRTGVKLIDVPNGRKDAADKAILIDMFLFALDNPLPSSIMLISGDVDFAPALHILGQRGYTVILVIPSGVGVSSALSNAGRFVWDWSSIARGEGFVPPAKFSYNVRGGRNDLSGNLMGRHSYDNITDGQNEEEAIVYRGISQSYYNSRDFALISNSVSEYKSNSTIKSRSVSLPSGLNEVSSCEQNESVMWVQPGDLNGLKGQLVKLLELSGGCLPFARVPGEYQKVFGRPLYVSEYGAMKLVNLLKKMGDTIAVEGKGQKRYVCLRSMKPEPSAPQVIILKRDEKGKGIQEEILGSPSSDECSDEEKVVEEENEKTNQNLEKFKHELQDILVSYSCRIFLGCFEAIYQQRYKKTLVYQSYDVNELEDLFDKVRDVVVLHEEPVSKKKFLAAIGG